MGCNKLIKKIETYFINIKGGIMENIWYSISVSIALIIISIIIVVVVLIQKPKDYLAIVAFCVIGSIGLTLLGTDHIKDLTNRETTIVTAKYVRYLSSGREATRYTRKMIFTVGGEEIGLYAPILTKRKYYLEMEEGKRYKIEYFNHTKIIKCYELIN